MNNEEKKSLYLTEKDKPWVDARKRLEASGEFNEAQMKVLVELFDDLKYLVKYEINF